MIRFEVAGIPGPQGSKRHVGGGRMIESSKKVKPWRAAVSAAARAHCVEPLQGAVRVEIIFYMPAPKRLPKGRVHPSVIPDADKLLRSTLDGMSRIAYHDDGQVTHIEAFKRYHPEGWTGAHITINYDHEPAK